MNNRKLIYEPQGRAGQYGCYAANIFKGCDHGCLYCYVPGIMRKTREDFHSSVKPVDDLFFRIAKDCREKYSEPIFLSFMCDPFPTNENLWSVTEEVIDLINLSGNSVNILTKGGMRAVNSFASLSKNPKNKIGATLTFRDLDKSCHWEPAAATPGDRLAMLSAAKDMGIYTWASIEPVIDPDESLWIMDLALPYVDEFKIGKWNHDAAANAIDWGKFARDAEEMMVKNNKKYILKNDLIEAASR